MKTCTIPGATDGAAPADQGTPSMDASVPDGRSLVESGFPTNRTYSTQARFPGTDPRRRQRWVNMRFGLELQAGFRIGGNAPVSFSSIDTAYWPIQSGVPGALDYR